MYPEEKLSYVFKSSITGKAIERASIAQLEDLLKAEAPGIDLDGDGPGIGDPDLDRYELFRMLLQPLEGVKQSAEVASRGGRPLPQSPGLRAWPARNVPYDEEFLLAALLHDVGKAIDPADHVLAGLAGVGRGRSPTARPS